MSNLSDLQQQAIVIRDETAIAANTAERVGNAFLKAHAAIQDEQHDRIESNTNQTLALNLEKQSRQQGDETLQAAIQEETSARETAIETERHDRQEADGNQTVALNLEKTLRQQGDEANSASVGYFVCDTAAATAAKVVNASGYVLRIGGNIRIEMTNANTADNATLNINGTGAKALYYNGAQASASNSWEAGEVVTVYYDGTKYQCASNGGGGTAESIGYVNADSLPLVSNVKQALDEIASETLQVFDVSLSEFEKLDGWCIDGRGKWLSGATNACLYKEVNAGDIFVLKGNTNTSTYYAFLTDMTHVSGASPSYVAGTSFVSMGTGEEKRISIPVGTVYLYLSKTVSRGDRLPQYLHQLTRSMSTFFIDCTSELERLDGVTKTPALDFIDYDYGTLNDGYIKATDGSIASSTNHYYTAPIPVSAGQIVDTCFYGSASMVVIAAYDSSEATTAILDNSVVGDGSLHYGRYIVPQGVTHLRICSTKNSVPQLYVHIHDAGQLNEKVDAVNEKVDDVRSFVSEYVAPEYGYVDKYFNGNFTTIANALCRRYDVRRYGKVYVTSSWLSAQAGYYTIVFTDASNTVLSRQYVCAQNIQLDLVRQEIAVPTGAAYLYVNSRGNAPVVRVPVEEVTSDREISVLFIGNSLTQDAVSYVPLLLKELAPNLRFKFYIWYHGGYTLAQHLDDITNDRPAEIFSRCENQIDWDNFTNVIMSSVLSNYKFDIVCMQQYFNYHEDPDVTSFNSIIEYIEDHYSHPFKVVTLFHQPKRDVADTVFNRTKAGNIVFLQDTVAEDMIPSGIATYRAMSTDLDSLGDKGHLSPDGTHSQEGLPCMLQAYVTAMWIFSKLGIQMSVNNCSTVVNNSNYSSINVPGPNLGTGVVIGTTEQVRLSQTVAVKALKEGIGVVNGALTT